MNVFKNRSTFDDRDCIRLLSCFLSVCLFVCLFTVKYSKVEQLQLSNNNREADR